jgi:hypothetical protein
MSQDGNGHHAVGPGGCHDFMRRGRQPLQQIAGGEQESLTGACEDDAPILALEQADAEGGFELADLLADGALREGKLVSGATEAVVPGRSLEGSELAQ